MAERPLLKLPDPEPSDPKPGRGRGPQIEFPTRKRQAERLEKRFLQLGQLVDDPDHIIHLMSDPDTLAPERAIVFELAGSLPEFHRKAAQIGLEFLVDDEYDFDPDDDFHEKDKPKKIVHGCIYLAMPNFDSLKQLISLWGLYCEGERMPYRFGIWKNLFNLLKDVRPWGPKDRLSEDTLQDLRDTVNLAPNEPVRFEVELWFRNSSEQREIALASFHNFVHDLGGEFVDQTVIAEIRYSAALIDLPADRVRELLSNPSDTIAKVDEIMFIRPQTSTKFIMDGQVEVDPVEAPIPERTEQPPIVALLDGFPVEKHQRLINRVDVDDPDNFGKDYLVTLRRHGTEMASLILHGDINRAEPVLDRSIHVRPILRPTRSSFNDWREQTPHDKLVVDLIYRAVRRMREGEGDQAATAPTVLLVNLSLGDQNRPFSGPMSPWGRLLDYLAYKYKLLFLVSAGNVREPLGVPGFTSFEDFKAASSEDRKRAVFKALNSDKSRRTLLSPAEAMNVITVGAAHGDAKPTGANPAVVDPIGVEDLPNMSSALGLGFRRIVKPDILIEGGREHVTKLVTDTGWSITPAVASKSTHGLLAAAPGIESADQNRLVYTSGTSASTALATRAGHKIYDALMDRDGGSLLADTPIEYHSLIIKALLIHGASWGESSDMLKEVVDGKRIALKDNVTRFLGHGVLDLGRVVECASERATLIGYGQLLPGNASLFRMPLPYRLDLLSVYRAVTVTVAWFSPINPRHQGYRIVELVAGPGGNDKYSLDVVRPWNQPSHFAISKGTIFHERREGEKAAAYEDDGDLLLLVSAKADAGEFDGTIPYAVAVSMEVEVGSFIQVYDEVRTAIETRVSPNVAP